MMKLLEICDISGKSVSRFSGNKKYIATGDIIDNKISSYSMVTYDNKPSRANIEINENEILFAKMINTRKVLLSDNDNINNIYSTGFYCIKPKDNVDINYLYYFINSEKFNNQKDKNCSGATQKAINNEGLEKITISNIPNINEQIKSANRLKKIDNLISIKKEQIKSLDELIKSQFVEMFGDIKDTEYNVSKLNDLANLITDGEHKKPDYTISGKPFISVVNITTGELKFDDCKYVSEDDNNKFRRRCNPELNDILYTKVGATYGRSAIVDTNIDFSLYVSVCLIKPKKEIINPLFLMHSLRQPYVKTQADKCIKGIGVPDLHLIEIKNFNIIVPPIELQNKFAGIVEQIDKQKFEFENSLKNLEELQASLMQEYFG